MKTDRGVREFLNCYAVEEVEVNGVMSALGDSS